MKVPCSWLKQYCDPGLEPDELAQRLALTGTEVERVSHVGPQLNDGNEAGSQLSGYLPIAEDVLELEVTPNRPDCLGVYGVAREVHAACDAPLAGSPANEDAEPESDGDVSDYISVSVEDPELCPRFTTRVFLDVEVGPSPPWLAERLAALGQRPINNVVDITNYVMFLLGQPMHAYDLDKVAGQELVVRRAREGETLTTLDGEMRAFDSDAVLVCDSAGPSGIGGIMGGSASEVTSATKHVLLEAANWDGPNILKTSKKLQLRSEASTRFEKQLHPELALMAQRVASKLMVELCNGRMVSGTLDVTGNIPELRRLELRIDKLEGLLGENIGIDMAAEILERLDFSTKENNGRLEVVVPAERHHDVQREADLIEEVARIHGLDALPATLPSRERAVGGLTVEQRLRRSAEDAMRYMGFSEVVTWSFISPDYFERLRLPEGDERRRALQIENPLSEEQSVMRTTLLPGMLDVARRNLSAHREELRLFESGRVFFSRGQTELANERHHLAALLVGSSRFKSWRTRGDGPDFYLAKGMLETLFEELGVEWRLAEGGPPFLHPGKAAEILCHGSDCGWIGEIHPQVAGAWGLEEAPVGFELDLDELLGEARKVKLYEDVVTYPAVYQDIAVIVEDEVEAQTVVEVVRVGAGETLASVKIFDLYRGEQIGEGKKSLAMRLEFRSPERTLTEEEVNERRKAIVTELDKELGATLRD